MKKYILILLLQLSFLSGYTQCPVHVKDSSITIYCGDSVLLSAYKDTIKPLFINFNNGIIDPLLETSSNATIADTSNYPCFGLSPEGKHYLFMNNSIDNPRYIESKPLDLTKNGATKATLCFRMKYGLQKANGDPHDPCEGIEKNTEGIYLEYFTTSWNTIEYYDPKGGMDSILTNWNKYCIDIPEEALTNHTKIRWIQKDSDGVGFDTWGIDDISLVLDIPGYKYSWNTNPSKSNYYITVAPTRDNQYTVTYTNGKESCNNIVKVFVIEPINIESAPSECQCIYLYIPNAFTPNGDALNDYFLPIIFGIKEYELEVFNRAGQVIFHTQNRDELWSGYNDQQSIYTYRLKLKSLQNIQHVYEGIIILIK